MTNSGISVIICCYESASRLPDTLRHLAVQDYENDWEIVLVDNNSTDNIHNIAREEWAKCKLPNSNLICVTEPIPGLTTARQTGVAVAHYDTVIFCDDDNWLTPGYLTSAAKLVVSLPYAGAVGGRCIAVPENGVLPDWFAPIQNNYAVGEQAPVSCDVTSRGYLWGAGLVTTKKLFQKCANEKFPLLLSDRAGEALSSGGDAELCSRIILAGYKLYYDRSLTLEHFIPTSRLTLPYLSRLIEGIDAAHNKLFQYQTCIKAANLSTSAQLAGIAKAVLQLGLNPLLKKWKIKHVKERLYFLGGPDSGVDNSARLIKSFQKWGY